MLKNAYLDAKIGFDPAENEPRRALLGALRGRVLREPAGRMPSRLRRGAAAPGPATRRGHLRVDGLRYELQTDE